MILKVMVRHSFYFLLLFLAFFSQGVIASNSHDVSSKVTNKQSIKALYIPLADHYAAILAYERYRNVMQYADFSITQMKNWDLLRAYFQSGEVDMAYVMTPLALDMFTEKPNFRWVGLMHRDGNALAINGLLNKDVNVLPKRENRKPDDKVALALKKVYKQRQKQTQIGMPHLLSTHSVVLYRYLKENGIKLDLKPNGDAEVLAIAVAPPKAPSFIKSKSNRAMPAAFEQSLPWADIVEIGGFGYIAWYSKDVMPWEHGHVECIALATDKAIKNKRAAINEVMKYIRKAGDDIKKARKVGGNSLEKIVKVIRKHIPKHTRASIIASLDPNLRVINYQHLNVDKAGLKLIMDLALEAGIIQHSVDIEVFSDTQFDEI